MGKRKKTSQNESNSTHKRSKNTSMNKATILDIVSQKSVSFEDTDRDLNESVLHSMSKMSEKKKRRSYKKGKGKGKTKTNVSQPSTSNIDYQITSPVDTMKKNAGDWFSTKDSLSNNYLRLVSLRYEKGKNINIPLSLLELIDNHDEMMQVLKDNNSKILNNQILTAEARLIPITKKYIDTNGFLVEPDLSKGHRLCPRDKKCMCYMKGFQFPRSVDKEGVESNAFIGREFLNPVQLEQRQKSGIESDDVRLCLLCNRALTCVLWAKRIHNMKTDGDEHIPSQISILDHYYDPVDTEGEYLSSACLSIAPNQQFSGVEFRFVAFSMNRYMYGKPAQMGGRKHLIETGVIYHEKTYTINKEDRMNLPDFH